MIYHLTKYHLVYYSSAVHLNLCITELFLRHKTDPKLYISWREMFSEMHKLFDICLTAREIKMYKLCYIHHYKLIWKGWFYCLQLKLSNIFQFTVIILWWTYLTNKTLCLKLPGTKNAAAKKKFAVWNRLCCAGVHSLHIAQEESSMVPTTKEHTHICDSLVCSVASYAISFHICIRQWVDCLERQSQVFPRLLRIRWRRLGGHIVSILRYFD